MQLSACLLIMLLAIAVGTLWSVRAAAQIREEAGTALLQTARDMADRLSREMAARARDVTLLTQVDLFRGADDPAAMRAALERLRGTLPAYAWIGVTDRGGEVIAGTDGVLVGKSIAARPVFQNGRKGLWTGDVHEAVMLAKLAPQRPGESVKFVDVAAPIHGSDGSFRGVLALHMSWQWAAEVRNAVIKPRASAASLQLLVLAADGKVLLGPAVDPGSTEVLPGLQETAVRQLDERWANQRWSDGIQAMTAGAESRSSGDFKGFGWRVLARDEHAASEATIAREQWGAWGWSLGAGAACALLAWWLVGWTMAPVDRLSDALLDADAKSSTVGHYTARRNDIHRIAARVTRLQDTLNDRNVEMRDLERIAHRDELTGLSNRTYLAQLTQKLEQEAADASSAPMEMCVLCLDLDHFKPINDQFGHAAGDQVLKQVATRLRHAARSDDFLFRLGGDEFLILLPCPVGEGKAVARMIATRILTDLQRPMSYLTLSNLRLGGSIGASMWRQGCAPLAEVIAQADEALYAAKRAGRGQFRQYAARLIDKGTSNTESEIHSRSLPATSV